MTKFMKHKKIIYLVTAECPYCGYRELDASTRKEAYKLITDKGNCIECGKRIEQTNSKGER